jgi:hypothetical protein
MSCLGRLVTGASYYHFLHDDLPLLLDNALDNMPLNRRQELNSCGFYMTVHLHITAGRLETF